MVVKFKGPQPVTARILHVLLGLLNWILAGMLVYLRWFPLERVLIRLAVRFPTSVSNSLPNRNQTRSTQRSAANRPTAGFDIVLPPSRAVAR